MSKKTSDETEPITSAGDWAKKYKEYIITTVICLFLTGIYDSVNNQTRKTEKLYRTIVKMQARVSGNLEDINDIKTLFDRHENRIRSLEMEVAPALLKKRRIEVKIDSLENVVQELEGLAADELNN